MLPIKVEKWQCYVCKKLYNDKEAAGECCTEEEEEEEERRLAGGINCRTGWEIQRGAIFLKLE